SPVDPDGARDRRTPRPHPAPSRPRRCALRSQRCPCPVGKPGPVPLEPPVDRRRDPPSRTHRPTPPTRPLPAPGSHSCLSRASATLGRYRLGADPAALRHAATPGAVTHHPPAPGDCPALC